MRLSVSHTCACCSSLEECREASPHEHTNELLRVKVFQVEQYRRLLVQHLREHEHLGSEWVGQLAEEDHRQAQPTTHFTCVQLVMCV